LKIVERPHCYKYILLFFSYIHILSLFISNRVVVYWKKSIFTNVRRRACIRVIIETTIFLQVGSMYSELVVNLGNRIVEFSKTDEFFFSLESPYSLFPRESNAIGFVYYSCVIIVLLLAIEQHSVWSLYVKHSYYIIRV